MFSEGRRTREGGNGKARGIRRGDVDKRATCHLSQRILRKLLDAVLEGAPHDVFSALNPSRTPLPSPRNHREETFLTFIAWHRMGEAQKLARGGGRGCLAVLVKRNRNAQKPCHRSSASIRSRSPVAVAVFAKPRLTRPQLLPSNAPTNMTGRYTRRLSLDQVLGTRSYWTDR